ncbi:hypothetical protein SAMN05192534_102151 [Alteribacillus persepolensis]|uniref:DUF8042 domain-containing protein n=1 Tax=Alteribacillus persepolensis TaxID=568899 RepID=A0A1G8AGJ1_9BACI|nr:hypothetical protein [Alteribacillus persepolensis]SDH20068.1 hypothetical protein SAMN05192534_102151 [Alteribacillus persepolensis]
MSRRLQEAEHVFLKRYNKWLQTVEEGLASVAYFYREGHVDNGDRLLLQMMEGFQPFSSDNMTMRYLFVEKEGLEEEMIIFHDVVEKAKGVPSFASAEERIRFIAQELIPSFQRWKLFVQQVEGGETDKP